MESLQRRIIVKMVVLADQKLFGQFRYALPSVIKRNLTDTSRNRYRETSAGLGAAENDIRRGARSLRSAVPGIQNRFRAPFRSRNRKGTARSDQNNHIPALRQNLLQEFFLSGRQRKTRGSMRLAAARGTFTKTADHDIVEPDPADLFIRERGNRSVHRGGIPENLLKRLRKSRRILHRTVSAPRPAERSALMNHRTDQQNLLSLDVRQRKGMFFILRKHHALGGNPANGIAVFLRESDSLPRILIRVGILEKSGAELHDQNRAHGTIKIFHRNLARSDKPRKVLRIKIVAHFNINTRMERLFRAVPFILRRPVQLDFINRTEVADNCSVESPAAAQCVAQKKFI